MTEERLQEIRETKFTRFGQLQDALSDCLDHISEQERVIAALRAELIAAYDGEETGCIGDMADLGMPTGDAVDKYIIAPARAGTRT